MYETSTAMLPETFSRTFCMASAIFPERCKRVCVSDMSIARDFMVYF